MCVWANSSGDVYDVARRRSFCRWVSDIFSHPSCRNQFVTLARCIQGLAQRLGSWTFTWNFVSLSFWEFKAEAWRQRTGASLLFFSLGVGLIVSRNFVVCFFILRGSATKSKVWSWCFYSSSSMTEYLLLILYFSAFICLCALVCLYFSGCQEMTYKHDGKVLCGVWKS